ncbi:DNA-directed DNA polymerase LALA0_S08e00782g [Lachancea lanzarotensis]|uniref:LALA0S08e00782g1_1 n=1 Tax=Lachancea lanzarotensis TaxID=1245769 RepID=A0A0C7NCI2_9SACH|nr:uncharacterized protein LALA0_S08e00782g [Lachancea lanzarotensis]CEP63366.1 LALA0S08e00782g1_1 [Lachancea lanzarotensis]
MKTTDESDAVSTKIDRDLFYKLASDLSEERLQATVNLVTELSKLSKESSEWSYVLSRLINGLSSSRNGARLGYGLCLTEAVFLALQNEVLPDIGHYTQLLFSSLSKEAVKNGKEERGLIFGKLFGLQVLLNEPLFSHVFKTGDAKSGSQVLNLDFTLEYATALIDVAITKTWIRESALYTLYQAIEKLAPLFTSSATVNAIFGLLDKSHLTLTSEGLAIYIFLLHTCPTTKKLSGLDKSQLQNSWKGGDPLKKGNLPLIASALKEANVSEDTSLKQKAVWAPRLHFVWDVLLPAILSTGIENSHVSEKPVSKKRKKDSHDKKQLIELPEFWKSVIDDSFFSEKASSERKYLGFLVFEKALERVLSSNLSDIFSTNFMRCLINQSGSPERNLHKISQKSLNAILRVCQENPEKTAPVLEAIAFSETGSIHFDKLTKSKTITNLLAIKNLHSEHLLNVVEVLGQHLSQNDNDFSTTRFAVDAVLHLIRAHKVQTDISWIEPCLDLLIQLGFFQKHDLLDTAETHIPTQSINTIAVERLYSVLADLLSAEKGPSKICWPYLALEKVLVKQRNRKLINAVDDEISSIFSTAETELQTVKNKLLEDQSNIQLWALQLLFSVNLLEAYSGEAESVSVLEDLISFSELYEENKDGSYAGFIEILLSLAAQKKALLRKSSLMIWESFVGQVSPDDLSVLLDVLPARENKEGYSNLFEGANEGESSEGEEDDDDDEDEEDENEEDEEEDEDASKDNGSSDEEEDDLHNDNTGTIEKEAASALAKALNLPDSLVDDKGEVHFDDLSGTGDDDEDSSDEDLDDEKMMELDDQLSEIFKRRKEALSQIPTGNKRKKEVQESRENVIAFKHKVVDMLEVMARWAEAESKKDDFSGALEKILETVVPLVECVRTTMDRPLAEKVSKLAKNKITKIKVSGVNAAGRYDKDTITELLRDIHQSMFSKKPGQFPNLFFSVCSSTSIFLAKLMIELDPSMETYFTLTKLYHESLNEWLKWGKFGVSMFTDFLNWLSLKKQQTTN